VETDLRVFGELEDAKDAENADEGECSAAFGALTVALGLLDDEDHKVREDGEHVDDIHHVTTEVLLRRTRRETDEKLAREPRNARLQQHTSSERSKIEVHVIQLSRVVYVSVIPPSHSCLQCLQWMSGVV